VGHPRLELMDWKRRVLAMYAAARAGGDDPAACAAFRATRDDLMRDHPQSPVDAADRPGFTGVPWFPHRPEMRVTAALDADGAGAELVIPTSTGEPTRFTRIGTVRPRLPEGEVALAVYWLEGYGGGLFLPFRDAHPETYGGGRYLLDTVKGADLGVEPGGALVIDFNYAYNPSCSYDPRWSCPLAPPENRLDVAVAAGERMPPGH
jgi:uncharacterized protein (DUF1684 family)